MKRVILLVLIGALVAGAILYGLHVAQKTSNAAVTALLPRETLFLVHLPNFKRTREEWRRSDIYKLYTEPAMQDFLRKPLARLPKKNSARPLQEADQLDLKDAFIAVTAMAEEHAIKRDSPRVGTVVAGFRFRGGQAEAEVIIDKWRSQLTGTATRGERVEHHQHKIDITVGRSFSVATAYHGHWFFASNDVPELKAVLDRADGRINDQQLLLSSDASFRTAMAEMPVNYAACLFLQPKILFQKLASLGAILGQPVAADERTLLGRVRSICSATRFDDGKMRDVIFVGMPKLEADAALTRNSVELATKDTFFYLASLLNLSKQLALDPAAAGTVLGARLRQLGATLATAGITTDDLKAAFGSELGVLADWPANARWPACITAFPIKDAVRARKIVDVLVRANAENAIWEEADRDGAHYWSMQSGGGLIAFHPTVGLSERILIVGLDATSVETAIRRSASSMSELSNSSAYKNATKAVPAPTTFFAYIDTALLYGRLDAALRPILLMGAAFMPAINENVDLAKLPAPEIITKHLSPIVSSQRYKNDGYVTESVGPITLNQAGIALFSGIATGLYQQGLGTGLNRLTQPSLPPAPVPNPSPSGSPQPAGTP